MWATGEICQAQAPAAAVAKAARVAMVAAAEMAVPVGKLEPRVRLETAEQPVAWVAQPEPVEKQAEPAKRVPVVHR